MIQKGEEGGSRAGAGQGQRLANHRAGPQVQPASSSSLFLGCCCWHRPATKLPLRFNLSEVACKVVACLVAVSFSPLALPRKNLACCHFACLFLSWQISYRWSGGIQTVLVSDVCWRVISHSQYLFGSVSASLSFFLCCGYASVCDNNRIGSHRIASNTRLGLKQRKPGDKFWTGSKIEANPFAGKGSFSCVCCTNTSWQ